MPSKWVCGHDSNVTICSGCGECCWDRCVCDCEKIRASEVCLTPREIKDISSGRPVYIKDSRGRSIKIIKM